MNLEEQVPNGTKTGSIILKEKKYVKKKCHKNGSGLSNEDGQQGFIENDK